MASSSRGAQQDSFIDDDDNSCPLCIEEFDLSDRNFKPCPCGYQVCQFCFNNIKENMNSLCPACRRPYDEKTMVWKVVTPEEIAKFKADVQKNAKKKADQRQKEAQKREVENQNRKHLSGLRVIQKNLVYVVGLSQEVPETDLLKTLRGDKYFGQYGQIIKIVVSKAKGADALGNSSLGVYVTFARKEDAEQCIKAVNGSTNGDRVLRAQLGTTKYCSAYLRNEICTNKQCMFLHEPGDNDNSYSRQDLSSINTVGTQRPLPATASSSRQPTQAQASSQQGQPVSTASQPMAREPSKDSIDSGDGSALPSTANWGSRGMQQRSRRGSMATSGAPSSPAISNSKPALSDADEHVDEQDDIRKGTPQGEPFAQSTSFLPPPPRPLTETEVIIKVIMAIETCGLRDLSSEYPNIFEATPLFDKQGGARRRAIREQEEAARLHVEQESQNDIASVSDTQEEDEPASGSGQLGGDPEDQDDGREGNTQPQGFLDARRPSMQMPIQRSSTDSGLFGGNLGQNYSQNLGNLSQINGRTLTPQQLLLLKSGQQPQSNFLDQFSSGIGSTGLMSQSGVLQHQGHGRQSSRYNFANEGPSSAKQSANSKILGQPSSVMGNQQAYYGSTIPGPPPGLKSTGTPPIGGGGLFGQGHGFGGPLGGSAYGGSGRDNQSDMIRELIRSRGGAGSGGQGHDAGKREFIFSSFLHQYPSASTPAPAPGLLASLYGPQPGAFHDFSQKQKKKGKKHRHANTSSSGGGALVDLADPNMQQARMPPQQQQSNAGVGQGLFGGQGQDDQALPFDEASMSVDALVADSAADFTEPLMSGFDTISRSSTPAVPPGLALPHAHPSPIMREDSIAKPPSSSRIVPTSAPFTPSRSASSAYIPRAATPLAHIPFSAVPTQLVMALKAAEPFSKPSAPSSGLSKMIEARTSQITTHQHLQQDEFPALEKGKEVPVGPRSMISSKNPRTISGDVNTATSSRPNTKQPTPGILNIAAVATINTPKGSLLTETTQPPVKSVLAAAAFPALPPSTPASAQPSATRPPKTLRITPTAKVETQSVSVTTSQPASSIATPHVPLTRQTSLVERAGTPVSEIISDNASITSNSLSRPSSPPPARIGSAPLRSTTKSQQKKQRRDAQKEKEGQLDTVVDKPEPEVEIAPIMGRKKKQKKEKITNATGESTPTASRPQSPSSKEFIDIEKPSADPVIELSKATAEMEITAKLIDIKGKGKTKSEIQAPPEVPVPVSEVSEEPPEKPTPTPSSILQDLISAGLISEPKELAVFKQPVYPNQRLDYSAGMQDWDHKLIITEEDRQNLLAGKAVRKTQGSSRIMLTPNGDCVRNLTPKEEAQYLELQTRILKTAGPAAFVPARHNASNGFTLIGGRAVPNGPPAFLQSIDSAGKASTIDPVSKIQRDEALSYINQYVLPSLSTNVQLERALNASALDAEMMRPAPESDFGGYGMSAAAEVLHTTANTILNKGLQNMTEHFARGRENERGQPLGSVNMLSLADAETAMNSAKKETEKLEKSLNQLLKKNRRLMLGSGN